MLVRFLIEVSEYNKTVTIRRGRRKRFDDTSFDDGGEIETVVFNNVDFVWTGDDEMTGVGIPRKVSSLERVGLISKFLNEGKKIVAERFDLSRSLVS